MISSRSQSYSTQILQLIDAFLVWSAFWIADQLRAPMREVILGSADIRGGLADLFYVLIVVVPLIPIALEGFGFYRDPFTKSRWKSIWQILRAWAVAGLAVGIIVIFFKITGESRWILGASAPIGLILLLCREAMTRSMVRSLVREEDAREAVVLVASQKADEDVKELAKDAADSIKIVTRFDPLNDGGVEDFNEVLKEHSVGKVVFLPKGIDFDKLSRLIELCELVGVESWIAADFLQTQVARPTFDGIGNKPMLVLRTTPELSWALITKEIFDRSLAVILLIAATPLLIFAAIGVKLGSPSGSIFFSQSRAGKYGRAFNVWKIRTMHPDAEAQLDEIKKQKGNQMTGPVFKLDDDPRVFQWGSFLRKTSIDELPQLVNVIRGEMSLVGPRPLPMYEVKDFDKMAYRRRLSVKPGITCTWQAGGRNSITNFEDWVKMDLEYIDNWSLWLDIKILVKTIPAVLFGTGAK